MENTEVANIKLAYAQFLQALEALNEEQKSKLDNMISSLEQDKIAAIKRAIELL